MCLIVLAIGQDPVYPLILAANRDEFHARPTLDAGWWTDRPDTFGGRDLQAGGAWLALHRSGRFATVTNYRDAEPTAAGFRSRGHLVAEFLDSRQSPLDYVKAIDGARYAGFNLIAGDRDQVAYVSNRGAGPRVLASGIYGLSNALLDGPWSKVERSKAGLRGLLDRAAVNETTLLGLLSDVTRGPAEEVEAGHLGFATMHALSAPFIVTPDYGTRCSSILLADDAGSWQMTERRFDNAGIATGDSRCTFRAGLPSGKEGQ